MYTMIISQTFFLNQAIDNLLTSSRTQKGKKEEKWGGEERRVNLLDFWIHCPKAIGSLPTQPSSNRLS